MDAAFKSAAYRFAQVRSIRESQGHPFFKTLAFGVGPLMPFTFGGKAKPTCRTEHICWFDHTQTSVQRLMSGKDIIVMKIYRLREESDVPHHDIEVLMLSLLSRLVARDVSPHVVLPIGRLLTPVRTANMLTGRVLKDGDYSVILSEHADTSLSALIQQKALSAFQLKALLFQVIYTLAIIQKAMPTFRHNDLHASNVLVQNFNADAIHELRPDACVVYDFKGTKFYLPVKQCDMRALLWDFFYASSQDRAGFVPTRHEDSVYSSRNHYYDMHKLVDSIHYLMPKARGELRTFIDSVVPDSKKCMVHKLVAAERAKLGIETDEFVTCRRVLLKHKYFDELKVQPDKLDVLVEYKSSSHK
jgi:hypothetical protein